MRSSRFNHLNFTVSFTMNVLLTPQNVHPVLLVDSFDGQRRRYISFLITFAHSFQGSQQNFYCKAYGQLRGWNFQVSNSRSDSHSHGLKPVQNTFSVQCIIHTHKFSYIDTLPPGPARASLLQRRSDVFFGVENALLGHIDTLTHCGIYTYFPFYFCIKSMSAKYPHFLITDTGVFGASRDPKAETGINPQFIVTEVQMNW